MHITRLIAADAPRYKALMLHAYAVADDAFTSTPEERAAEPDAWWASRIAEAKGLSQVYGAFSGNELVGAVALAFATKPKIKHKAHLVGLFVNRAARGLGVGKALVQAALAAAAARPGIAVITLTVTEGNAAALALYEACGFKTFGIEPMALATLDGYKSKVHMGCKLAQPPACRPDGFNVGGQNFSDPDKSMNNLFAATPQAPYYAVIFSSLRTSGENGYEQMAQRMLALAAQQAGFLGAESARGDDGFGITVSYWASEDAITRWKANLEHLAAQQLGKAAWYEHYEIRVAKVERAYGKARVSP